MIIEVTKRDISLGIRRSSCYCPIAIATSRKIAEARQTRNFTFDVAREYANYIPPGMSVLDSQRVNLPSEAIVFVRDFDNGKPVNPFSFELELNA